MKAPLLPRIDFLERHGIDITAPAGTILDCAAAYRLKDDPLVRAAIGLRELPARLLGKSARAPFDRDDFTFLGRDRDRALFFGLIGAFWKADYGLVACSSPEDFRACSRSDVCKLLLSFTLTPLEPENGTNHRLTTETAVFCPTNEIRRRFAPYWFVIRPVSGLIRRRMLAIVRRQAEGRAALRAVSG